MRTALAVVAAAFIIALAVMLPSVCPSSTPTQRVSSAIVPVPIVAHAWEEAKRRGLEASVSWDIPAVVRLNGYVAINQNPETQAYISRHWGDYQLDWQVAKDGEFVARETITLYVAPPEITEQLVHALLVHELLHAIYMRRGIEEPEFFAENPDSETWIRARTEGLAGLP